MHHRHRRRRRHGPGGFGRGRFFGPGEVRLALLALLREGPKHGYELMKELEEGKKVYRLTPEGEREVEDNAEHVERIWRRAREWGDWSFVADPDAAEIVRPALRLARSAYRAVRRSHGDEDVVERVRTMLDRARDEIDELRRER